MDQSYVYAVDPYPQTGPEHNRLHPFYTALTRGELTTTQCSDCGHVAWPPQIICAKCLSSEVKWVTLPDIGVVKNFTVQEAGLPTRFKGPVIFALVEVAGLRIFTTLVECRPGDVHIDLKVRLHVTYVPGVPEGEPRPRHTFSPATP